MVKEAALFNLATLRSQTVFRLPSGHMMGWEGAVSYTHLIRWTGGLTSGSFISLQTIPWMDAKSWIITEPGSSWNFALETASSMQESVSYTHLDVYKRQS